MSSPGPYMSLSLPQFLVGMTDIQEIRLLAADLADGENRYTDCPACGRPGKFSIMSDEGRAVYHCFRASCKLHAGGSFSVNGSRLVRTRSEPRKQSYTPFEGELEYLDDEWLEYLSRKIGFTDRHIDIGRPMYAPEEHRVAFPIFSPLGRRRGWSLRSYSHAEPKALTRMDAPEPHISWYKTNPADSSVVVVEDPPSAIRCAVYRNALSLQGTGVGPDYAQELAAHARHVVWALDADATTQSMKLHRKYSLMFESSSVMVLDKDFKDMEEDQLCQLLQKTG